MDLNRLHSVEDMRAAARKRLPAPVFHYIDGGADDEVSLKRNTSAFDDYTLVPNHLNDISKVDTSIELFARTLDWPVILSPTAMTRFFHAEGERAAAMAADRLGTLYTLSTVASTSLEDIAAMRQDPGAQQSMRQAMDLCTEVVPGGFRVVAES